MANSFFRFKQFTVQQDACAMKVTTDACLFGAWCASELKAKPVKNTVLDIGTGTGLLSLMLAQKENLVIDAVEIDEAAAAQAKKNIEGSPWHNTITVINDDIVSLEHAKKYHYIISNPPFYENDLQGPDQKRNTAHHSQHLSLNALFQVIENSLDPHGTFFLLLPFKRKTEAMECLASKKLFVHKEVFVQQTPGHAPIRLLIKGGWEKTSCTTATIIIKDDTNQYAPQFVSLLQDYYLYL